MLKLYTRVNEYSKEKNYIKKMETEAKNAQLPEYVNRLWKIVRGKPENMSIEIAINHLENGLRKALASQIEDTLKQIYPSAPKPTKLQNSNAIFLESAISIYGIQTLITELKKKI